VKAAGLPRIRIHDLRHTHVTLALQAGANVRAVSERVGHAGVSITLGTYAHVLPAQHAEVAAKEAARSLGFLWATTCRSQLQLRNRTET
jgi:integrase